MSYSTHLKVKRANKLGFAESGSNSRSACKESS